MKFMFGKLARYTNIAMEDVNTITRITWRLNTYVCVLTSWHTLAPRAGREQREDVPLMTGSSSCVWRYRCRIPEPCGPSAGVALDSDLWMRNNANTVNMTLAAVVFVVLCE